MKAVNVDEVLKILHKYGKYIFVTDEKRYSSMVDEIANLKALEQESKSEWQQDHEILKAYSDGANAVLDKIRAEIEERKLNSGGEPNRELAFNVCLQIIDRYTKDGE